MLDEVINLKCFVYTYIFYNLKDDFIPISLIGNYRLLNLYYSVKHILYTIKYSDGNYANSQ